MLNNYKIMYFYSYISNLMASPLDIIFLWIIIIKTDSILFAGLGLTFLFLPTSLSFFTGYLTDNIKNKKTLLIFINFLRILTAIFIIFDLINFKFVHFIVLLILFLIFGFFNTFTNNIFRSIEKYTVDENKLNKYFKIIHILYFAGSISGLLISGILLSVNYNFAIIFIIIALFVQILLIKLIDTKNIDFNKNKQYKSKTNDLINSILYIKNHKLLLDIIIIGVISDFIASMLEPVLTYITHDILKINAFFLTLFAVFIVLGSITGTLFAGKIKGKVYKYYLIIMFLLPVFYYFIYIVSDNLYFIFIVLFILGLLSSFLALFHSILYFKNIDRENSGKIYGFNSSLNGIVQPFSGVIIGFIISFYLLKIGIDFMVILLFINFFILLFILKDMKNASI